MQRTRSEFYVDTTRETQDVPNLFSAFTEQYLAYRVPVAMTWMRARMEAMQETAGAADEYAKLLVDLAKQESDVAREYAKLAATVDTNGAQRDANFAQIKVALEGTNQAWMSANATVQAAGIGARGDVAVAEINRDKAFAEGQFLTDETRKAYENARLQVNTMLTGIQQGRISDDDIASRMAAIRSEVDSFAVGPKRMGLQNAINDLIRNSAMGLPPEERPRLLTGLRSFSAGDPTNISTPDPSQLRGGIPMPKPGLTEYTEEYRSSGAADQAFRGGGSTSTTTSAGTSGPAQGATGTDQGLAADAASLLKRQLEDLAAQRRAIEARQAAAAADTTNRGLGGIFDPIPGGRPARARSQPADRGGASKPEPEPVKTAPAMREPEGPSLKERAAKLAGSFLGGAVDRAFSSKEERKAKREERREDKSAFTGPNSDDNRKTAFTGPNSDDNRKTRKKVDPNRFMIA